jgi:hypothetical protein
VLTSFSIATPVFNAPRVGEEPRQKCGAFFMLLLCGLPPNAMLGLALGGVGPA